MALRGLEGKVVVVAGGATYGGVDASFNVGADMRALGGDSDVVDIDLEGGNRCADAPRRRRARRVPAVAGGWVNGQVIDIDGGTVLR